MQITDVTEFGIYNQSVYKIYAVNIDRSVLLRGDAYSRNPDFKRETLALKALVEGTADLYYYKDGDIIRFFFRTGDRAVEQLVYKEYMIDGQHIAKNELFKQQLWTEVKCGEVTEAAVRKLRYDKEVLEDYFQEFNLCSGDAPLPETKPERKSVFLKLSPGIGFSTLTVDYKDSYQRVTDKFVDQASFHLGAEIEFIMPFNKNKWGLLIEPSFNTFLGKEDETEEEVKHNTFEIGLGVRHYFFLNQDSKIFLNASLMGYVPLDELIEYQHLETSVNYGAAFGAGYAYKRLSLEIRYQLKHDVILNYVSWSAQQTKSMLVLGYRIL